DGSGDRSAGILALELGEQRAWPRVEARKPDERRIADQIKEIRGSHGAGSGHCAPMRFAQGACCPLRAWAGDSYPRFSRNPTTNAHATRNPVDMAAPSPAEVGIRSALLRVAFACFALSCVSTSGNAAGNASEIHKCATPTGIAYQGLPCSGAELPAPVVDASAAQAPSVRAPAGSATNDEAALGSPVCGPRPRDARRLPWRQPTICIGMTDDEVLNLPGCGRPARITRTRAPREWREEWTYDAGLAGPRQLYFVNGTLTAVEWEFVETAAGKIANLATN